MHQFTTMLLVWVGVSGTSLGAAILMVLAGAGTTIDDAGAGAVARSGTALAARGNRP